MFCSQKNGLIDKTKFGLDSVLTQSKVFGKVMCDALCDMLPVVQFKPEAYNFTKINTPL